MKNTKLIFKLTTNEIQAIQNEKKNYENAHAVSIEALKIVQKNRGWISDNAIYEISKILEIPVSDLESVATFYSQIFRKPVGKYIIRFCDSFVCYITGYKKVQKEIEKILKIKPGQTTLDEKFTLLPTCCLGNCDKSPIIMINKDTHIFLRPSIIGDLLEKYK